MAEMVQALSRGRFITLEGGDGSGKSTQARRLAATLGGGGIDVVVTREPGGSPGAEDIRSLLVNGAPGRWDPLSETLLLYAARHDHIERTIRPALAAGKWVISDRFSDSTFAYQGAGGGLNRETIRRIESVSIADFKPDLTLILDLPVAVGLDRTRTRAWADGGNAGEGGADKDRAGEDRYENFDIGFHERLRQGYLDAAKRATGRCVVIDASESVDAVADAIRKAVCERLRVRLPKADGQTQGETA